MSSRLQYVVDWLWPRTLYQKMALILWLLVFGLASAQYYISTSLSTRAEDRRDQMLYANTANVIAHSIVLSCDSKFTAECIRAELAEASLFNPRIDVFLLDASGKVLLSNLGAWRHEAGQIAEHVPLQPLHSFLTFNTNKELPLYAQNPAREDQLVTFSAAEISLTNFTGYLFVVLNGTSYQSATSGIMEYYATFSGLVGTTLLSIFTIAMGTLLFFVVTKRFRRISSTVGQISAGHLGSRTHIRGNDELGELGSQIDSMADTIEETLQSLTEIDSTRREFIARVSHDLRGPLSAARGYAEQLAQQLTNDLHPAERTVTQIISNLDWLERMIADLLQLSKLEMKEHQAQLVDFDLIELCDELLARAKWEAEKKQITLQCRHDNDDELYVSADVQLIERALFNLIDNAIRYNTTGGSVRIDLASKGNRAEISITDTGTGISEEDYERIFEPFYRSKRHHESGSGLGLPIVKLILDAHDAHLLVKTDVDHGTRFAFSLPLADEIE